MVLHTRLLNSGLTLTEHRRPSQPQRPIRPFSSILCRNVQSFLMRKGSNSKRGNNNSIRHPHCQVKENEEFIIAWIEHLTYNTENTILKKGSNVLGKIETNKMIFSLILFSYDKGYINE